MRSVQAAAAVQLLLLLHLRRTLCWTREDFEAHNLASGANETYFPPVPGLSMDSIETAWTHHIHFAVRGRSRPFIEEFGSPQIIN